MLHTVWYSWNDENIATENSWVVPGLRDWSMSVERGGCGYKRAMQGILMVIEQDLSILFVISELMVISKLKVEFKKNV